MAGTTVTPKTKVKTKIERPRLHKVILVNDDFTPREFVTMVLKGEFRMTEEEAYKVMITAHRRGVCVVAVYAQDIAETKATRATDAGRSSRPLSEKPVRTTVTTFPSGISALG